MFLPVFTHTLTRLNASFCLFCNFSSLFFFLFSIWYDSYLNTPPIVELSVRPLMTDSSRCTLLFLQYSGRVVSNAHCVAVNGPLCRHKFWMKAMLVLAAAPPANTCPTQKSPFQKLLRATLAPLQRTSPTHPTTTPLARVLSPTASPPTPATTADAALPTARPRPGCFVNRIRAIRVLLGRMRCLMGMALPVLALV